MSDEGILSFIEKLTRELIRSPPKLQDNVLDEKSFGDWLAARFTPAELQVLRDFEDAHGSEKANKIITLTFRLVGLPDPKHQDKK